MFEAAMGRVLHGVFPLKRAVIIYSAMRSGSTLLKALLGMNPEISHLPEIRYQDWPLNRHAFYYRLFRAAREPVVVLKKPCFYTEIPRYPVIPPIEFVPVVLIRNPVDTALSMRKRVREHARIRRGYETYGKGCVTYWCETYRNLHKRLATAGLTPHFVYYEQLLREPDRVTRQVFERIGTTDTHGVRTYQPYGEWQWGHDDAGDRIRLLTVVERPRRQDEEAESVLEEVRSSANAAEVMRLYDSEDLAYGEYLKAGGYL